MSLGLLGAYVSSDSESTSEDEDHGTQQKTKPVLTNPFMSSVQCPTSTILPRPSFMVQQEDFKKDTSKVVENSVFQNPFRVKEDKKKAILERHVEMTVKQEDQRTIDGKKVCWNFRKGRCRFGSNCSFAHDSDVKHPKLLLQSQSVQQAGPSTVVDELSDDAVVIDKKTSCKKRPGLSEGLEPSKKAMKFHQKVYSNSK